MSHVEYYYFTVENVETEEKPIWMMKDLWDSNRIYFKELQKSLKNFDNKEKLFVYNQEKLDRFYEKSFGILKSPILDTVQKILKLRYEVYMLQDDNVLIHKLRLSTIKDWKNAISKKYFTIFSNMEELENDIEHLNRQRNRKIVEAEDDKLLPHVD